MNGRRTIGLALLMSAALLTGACGSEPAGQRAEIVQDGRVLRTVDLSSVRSEERMTVSWEGHTNTILIAPGEIRMLSADCPDQICVRSGKLIEGGLPIVCLPHRLVIQWAD